MGGQNHSIARKRISEFPKAKGVDTKLRRREGPEMPTFTIASLLLRTQYTQKKISPDMYHRLVDPYAEKNVKSDNII